MCGQGNCVGIRLNMCADYLITAVIGAPEDVNVLGSRILGSGGRQVSESII